MRKIKSIIVFTLVVVMLLGLSMTAYAVEENYFKGRRVDQIGSGSAVMEERAQPLQKESIFKRIFTLSSTPKYSMARSTVKLIDLGFNQ